jgi:hypothetical protein
MSGLKNQYARDKSSCYHMAQSSDESDSNQEINNEQNINNNPASLN